MPMAPMRRDSSNGLARAIGLVSVRPYPSLSMLPASFSQRETTAGVRVIAPEIEYTTRLRSRSPSRATRASRSNIGGTAGMNVGGNRFAASTTSSGSNVGNRTARDPVSTE